jgi:FMN phosphatase YigB (HAD superfamily)
MNQVSEGRAATEEVRLGQVVQRARRAAGFTQQALCQQTGLSYSTLAKIERGAIKTPSVFTIRHIAATLGISLDELLQDIPLPGGPVAAKKVSKNGVRFVYFDMNGSLVRFYNAAFNHLAEEAGTTPDVVEAVFWQYNDEVNRGTKGVDELNAALQERLGIPVDWSAYYLKSTEAIPGMQELVQWAAGNYRIGILTNTMPGLVDAMMKSGVLPQVSYDVIVESCAVHALKPEPEMFAIAAEKAGVDPHEILLIDDERPNLIAARRLGWHTFTFDAYQPEESIANIYATLQPAE